MSPASWCGPRPTAPTPGSASNSPRDGRGYGTDLRWTLFLDEPTPDDALVGLMRRRINGLINADLRYTFAQ